MILTHGANSLERGGDFVEIGGRKYPVVKIGNQLWMAENLDYKFDVNGSQIPIGQSGTPTTPAAWYYDNDEATWGWDGRKCGLLYNWYAVNYLETNKSTLIPGWHIPSLSELTALLNCFASENEARMKLSSSDVSWASSWNGTDDYGFAILPAGYCINGSYGPVGKYATLWSSTVRNDSVSYAMDFELSRAFIDFHSCTTGYSVRLVKDAP